MAMGLKVIKSTLKFKVIDKKINLQLFAKLWAKIVNLNEEDLLE